MANKVESIPTALGTMRKGLMDEGFTQDQGVLDHPGLDPAVGRAEGVGRRGLTDAAPSGFGQAGHGENTAARAARAGQGEAVAAVQTGEYDAVEAAHIVDVDVTGVHADGQSCTCGAD